MLGKAIAIASEAFKNKKDKGGQPYILHCLHVMQEMPADDEELRCIAVLHDLVEDTSWTVELLKQEGFSSRVTHGVELLTHREEDSYEEYIRLISTNKDTVLVKLADLRHNSDITRIKGLSVKDFKRIEKYHKSYTYLKTISSLQPILE